MNFNHITPALKQFELFRGLPDSIIQKYLPYVYSRTYKKNQYLFMEGDPRDKIFFLVNGYVMYEKGSEEGSMLYLDFVKSNQMFPYAGLFKDEAYNHSALAVTDIDVYFIQTHILEDLLRLHSKQLIHIIRRLSDILILHQKRVERITIPNAQERVLHTLQFLMEDLGEKHGDVIVIPCPLTATNIAKISGTSRETVSMIMNQLKRDKVISVTSKIITVHHPAFFNSTSVETQHKRISNT